MIVIFNEGRRIALALRLQARCGVAATRRRVSGPPSPATLRATKASLNHQRRSLWRRITRAVVG